VPLWSGSSAGKVLLNRGGNRAMNHALHRIATTQASGIGPGRGYEGKQMGRGKDKTTVPLRPQLSDARRNMRSAKAAGTLPRT
jgi:transposase